MYGDVKFVVISRVSKPFKVGDMPECTCIATKSGLGLGWGVVVPGMDTVMGWMVGLLHRFLYSGQGL